MSRKWTASNRTYSFVCICRLECYGMWQDSMNASSSCPFSQEVEGILQDVFFLGAFADLNVVNCGRTLGLLQADVSSCRRLRASRRNCSSAFSVVMMTCNSQGPLERPKLLRRLGLTLSYMQGTSLCKHPTRTDRILFFELHAKYVTLHATRTQESCLV